MAKMQEWIGTRGVIHRFTEELLNTIVSEHRTGDERYKTSAGDSLR
jgi:hypothetical protein